MHRLHHEDVTALAGTRVVGGVHAAARAATCLHYDDAVALLDHVCRPRRGRPRIALARVLALVAAREPARARALAIDVDTASRSFRETEVRLGLRRAGLRAATGLVLPGVGEVDLLVEGVVVAEIDGFAYHSERAEYVRDRRRDRSAIHLGHPTLRFAYEDSTVPRVLGSVQGVLAANPEPLPFAPRVPADVRVQVAAIRASALRAENRRCARGPATQR